MKSGEIPIGEESLAPHAIEAFVFLKLDVTGVVYGLQNALDHAPVVGIRGADEAVVADVEKIPGFTKGRRVVIGRLLRGFAAFAGDFEHFLAVLVAAGQEKGVLAQQGAVTGQRIRDDGRIGVTDMGFGIDVVDGRGDVENFAHDRTALRMAKRLFSAVIWLLVLRRVSSRRHSRTVR